MKEQRSEDVLFFFLDDYKKIGIDYLQERIFAPLGLENTDAALKKATQGPANASAQLGLIKKDSLSLLQAMLLKLYPQPLKEYATLYRDFG